MIELEFLRFCLGITNEVSFISESNWNRLYEFCVRQSILGICFSGVERLQSDSKTSSVPTPPFPLLMEWIFITEQIEGMNKSMNKRCVELQELFNSSGLPACILKGQGNALLYPDPLRRQCGDIDVWVGGGVKRIVKCLLDYCKIEDLFISYYHTPFPKWNDIEVEVHWKPSWRMSLIYNRRMQKWFKEQAKEQMENIDEESGLIIPTIEFNLVYQLQHVFLHLLREGIGLRQIIDYYYLLVSNSNYDRVSVVYNLKYLGLWKFACSMMYVMKFVFLLDDKYMIAPANTKHGKFLLTEILQAGNFGMYDQRNSSLITRNFGKLMFAMLKRQFRYFMEYPSEVIWAPFQIYHVVWRKLNLWRIVRSVE